MNSPVAKKYRMSLVLAVCFSMKVSAWHGSLSSMVMGQVKKVAASQGVIPFNKQSSVTRSVREIANRLEVLRPNEMELSRMENITIKFLCCGSHCVVHIASSANLRRS
jgi:hypothetical protein